MLGLFRCLWQYRQFVTRSIYNVLFAQFARSKLGGLWVIINPLSQVLIYSLILSNILLAKLPGIDSQYAYAIYLMAGLLAWNLFSEIISRCLNLFIAQANIMKKISFPRITLPTIVVGSCLLNNLLLFICMLGIFSILGHQFTLIMFWLIPLTLIVGVLSLGIGLIAGVMNVFIRDIGQAFAVILQVWFWFTPIVYPATIVPESYRHLMQYNPMYPLVEAYHQILVYNQVPDLQSLIIMTGIAGTLALIGLLLFRQASAEMIDIL